MRCHERLEQSTVVRYSQMKQFVGDDEILKGIRLIQ